VDNLISKGTILRDMFFQNLLKGAGEFIKVARSALGVGYTEDDDNSNSDDEAKEGKMDN